MTYHRQTPGPKAQAKNLKLNWKANIEGGGQLSKVMQKANGLGYLCQKVVIDDIEPPKGKWSIILDSGAKRMHTWLLLM